MATTKSFFLTYLYVNTSEKFLLGAYELEILVIISKLVNIIFQVCVATGHL